MLAKTCSRCCIDKTSSAELSEAINSMFSWYQNAAVCYAYLSDVPKSTDVSAAESSFSKSRWFTRGWTLQELIAPCNLVFFSMDWHTLGTKIELSSRISSITGIERKFLSGKSLELASAAKIMSWAALRKTSRVEDIAYCLLGLFDINMPLIYGEGKKAFRRLQEEIMTSRSEDHSLFAWGTIVATPSIKITDPDQLTGAKPIPRTQAHSAQPLLGLLAAFPLDFASAGGFIPSPNAPQFIRSRLRKVSVPLAVDKGVRLELPLLPGAFDSVYHWNQPEITQIRSAKMAVLFCCHEKEPYRLVNLPLQPWGFHMYGRTREIVFDGIVDSRQFPQLMSLGSMLSIAPERQVDLGRGDIIIRRHLFGSPNLCGGWRSSRYGDRYGDRINSDLRIPAHFLHDGGQFGVCHRVQDHHWFAISLSRVAETGALVTKLFSPIKEQRTLRAFEEQAPTRPSMRKLISNEPAYYHVMNMPSDRWNIDVKRFPRISIMVERVFLNQDDSFVDVTDLVVWPASGAFTSEGRDADM